MSSVVSNYLDARAEYNKAQFGLVASPIESIFGLRPKLLSEISFGLSVVIAIACVFVWFTSKMSWRENKVTLIVFMIGFLTEVIAFGLQMASLKETNDNGKSLYAYVAFSPYGFVLALCGLAILYQMH